MKDREEIMDGKKNVKKEKDCEFDGIKCKIKFGEKNERKNRKGLIDMKELMKKY